MNCTGDTINLIVDTDIGPDCDDAGALGLLHLLSEHKKINFLCMTNCTSNPFGCGCIDAINIAFDKPDIPIGIWENNGFLCDESASKYNKYITQNYENRFKDGKTAVSASELLKSTLRSCEDNSVTFLAIGPLNNLAKLVSDTEGEQLVAKKVKCLYSMACGLSEAEWNVKMDIQAAQAVVQKWHTPILFSLFETGAPIITGRNWGKMSKEHPVRKAYELFGANNGRNSWDLTAVWAAVMGCEPYFIKSEKGDLIIDDDGFSRFIPNETGRIQFLLNRESPEKIAVDFDKLWK